MPLRVSPEDLGPLLAALSMIIEEVDLGLQPNYGIQVAADRVVWQLDMRSALAALKNPELWSQMKRSLFVEVPLGPPAGRACGEACIVAANRLDHYSGIVSETTKGGVHAAMASQAAHEPTLELVERYFLWVRGDAAWARHEALRLRLLAHELTLHGSADISDRDSQEQ